jgi:hypothetical protein
LRVAARRSLKRASVLRVPGSGFGELPMSAMFVLQSVIKQLFFCAGVLSNNMAIFVQACLHSIGYPITRRWQD